MKPIIPMEPKRVDTLPKGSEWLAQIKWDGVRILTYYENKVRLFNRKTHERTFHYPELANIQSYCKADSVILDGEVIALGPNGKPSFHEVMRRDGIRRMERVEQVRKTVNITYMIFDVLYFNGQWLTGYSLDERISVLSNIMIPNETVQLVSSHDDGQTLFDVMKSNGMEGIIMKKKVSPYVIGEKKDCWVKVKNYRDLIAVIGGFTLRDGIVNAILMGLYDEEGQLWYIGHSGTGKLSNREWRELTNRLRPLEIKERPFVNVPERQREAHYVHPELTVKIKYAEWTEGRSLRQPSIQGFVDVPAYECLFRVEMLK
jgi:bifunctional non-homologous end joining protein LigD